MTIDSPKHEHILGLRELWKEAFGDGDTFLDVFFGKVFSASRCRCVIENGKVIASLYWFDCEYEKERVAYLYAIATLEEYRGKGVCSALMKDTHSYLKSCGYSLAMLVPASEKLFTLYEKFGYKTCTSVNEKTVYSSNEKINLNRISVEEYGKLRRELLPEKSVIQENENLVLLDVLADFYKCGGAIFAVQKGSADGDLRIVELLGNTDLAPSIIGVLGYKIASVRLAGDGRAFSMCISFCGDKLAFPKYFGLAFD